MKKFLGIGFVFSAIDKGLNKFFDKANNNVEDFNDKLEDTGNVKSKKGSVLSAIGEIAKLGILKSINDGVSDLGDKLQNAQKGIVGGGLSEEFKTVEGLTKRLTLRLGDAAKATQLVDKTISGVVKSAKITTETATEITGAFVANNLNIEKFNKSLLLSAKFSKAFDLGAQEISNSFALGLKTIGLSEKALQDITSQVTLLETKTGLSGIAGNLPNVLTLVQKQLKDGIITKAQAKGQIQRINSLITSFRNTGVEIGTAQSFVEGLTNNIGGVTEAFAKVRAGIDSGELSGQAQAFGRLGLNIQEVQNAFQSGNITAAFNQITQAGARARKVGGKDLQAFNLLIKEAFGEESLDIIAAASTKAFGQVNNAIASTNKALRDGTAIGQAEKNFSVLTDTVEDQETQLKGLNQEFERGVSNSIAGSIKEYNKFKITTLENLADATKGTDNFFLKGVVALKKFQQGGLLPFTKSLEKLPFITKEGIFKVNSAIETIGPILKDGADDAFFLTGALANLGKIAPSPIDFFKNMGGKALDAGSRIKDMGKSVLDGAGRMSKLVKDGGGAIGMMKNLGGAFTKVGGLGGIFSSVMNGVGVAVRFAGGPVLWITSALVALGAGLVYAYKNSETFRNIVNDTWETVKEFGDFLLDFGGKTLTQTWEAVKVGGNFFMEWLNPIGLISKAVQGLGSLFPNVFGGLTNMMRPITSMFDGLGNKISKTFDSVKSFVKDSTVGKIFGELFGGKDKELTVAEKEQKKSGGLLSRLNPFSPSTSTTPTAAADNVIPINRARPQPLASNASQAQQVLGASTGQPAFSATPVKALQERESAQKNIQDQNIKNLAIIFSSIGQEIVTAIKEGQSTVEIQLKGDARKLFSAGQSDQNNRMVRRGYTG